MTLITASKSLRNSAANAQTRVANCVQGPVISEQCNLLGAALFNKQSDEVLVKLVNRLRSGTSNKTVYCHDGQLNNCELKCQSSAPKRITRDIWNNLSDSAAVAQLVEYARRNPSSTHLVDVLGEILMSLFYLVSREATDFVRLSIEPDSGAASKRLELFKYGESVCEILEYRNEVDSNAERGILSTAVQVLLVALDSKSVSISALELQAEKTWLLSCLNRFNDVLDLKSTSDDRSFLKHQIFQAIHAAVTRIEFCINAVPLLSNVEVGSINDAGNQQLENFLSKFLHICSSQACYDNSYCKHLKLLLLDIVGGLLGGSELNFDSVLGSVDFGASLSANFSPANRNSGDCATLDSTENNGSSAPVSPRSVACTDKDSSQRRVSSALLAMQTVRNAPYEEACFLQLLVDRLTRRSESNALAVYVKYQSLNLFRAMSRLDDKRPLIRSIGLLAVAASMSIGCAEILIELVQNMQFLAWHVRSRVIYATAVAILISPKSSVQDRLLKRGLFYFLDVKSQFTQHMRGSCTVPVADESGARVAGLAHDRYAVCLALAEIVCETNARARISQKGMARSNDENINHVCASALSANMKSEGDATILEVYDLMRRQMAHSLNGSEEGHSLMQQRPSIILQRHGLLPGFVSLSIARASFVLEKKLQERRKEAASGASGQPSVDSVSREAFALDSEGLVSVKSPALESVLETHGHRQLPKGDETLFNRLLRRNSEYSASEATESFPTPAISPEGFHLGYLYMSPQSKSRIHIEAATLKYQLEKQKDGLQLIQSALAESERKLKPSLLMSSLKARAASFQSQFQTVTPVGEGLTAPFKASNIPLNIEMEPELEKPASFFSNGLPNFSHKTKVCLRPEAFLAELQRPPTGHCNLRKCYNYKNKP